MGCGTGLIGLELEKYCNYLEGIDLSIKMIEEAKQKVYDKLIQTEIIDYLNKYANLITSLRLMFLYILVIYTKLV